MESISLFLFLLTRCLAVAKEIHRQMLGQLMTGSHSQLWFSSFIQQVFHVCDISGRQDSFLCPNGTIFSQKLFACDWWYNVQCAATREHYQLNRNLFKVNNKWLYVPPLISHNFLQLFPLSPHCLCVEMASIQRIAEFLPLFSLARPIILLIVSTTV
jgi:hypothetical protein